MAKYSIIYLPEEKVRHELTYKNEVFSYTMVPVKFRKAGNNFILFRRNNFTLARQVLNKFSDEPEEVIEALNYISYADDDKRQGYLMTLSNYET